MTTNFQVNGTDWDNLFIRKDYFSEGGLWLWGFNQISGALGDNTAVSKSSPVQTVAGGTNWKQAAGFAKHTAAIKSDGTLWLFGHNQFGGLGDNTTVNRSSPVQTVSAGTNWKQVAGGQSLHTVAIKTDGTLWAWGHNDRGNLGDNTTIHRSSPVQTVAAGTNWKQAACGAYYTVAIKTDGTLWSFGHNFWGALGDNTTVNKSSPVQTVAGGTNWKQVASSTYTTVAVKTDGTLWAWGTSDQGQIGDNISNVYRSSPVQTISGGTNWKQAACGSSHTLAIKTDGTLWTWGAGGEGELGDNTTVTKSSPVQTVAGGTNWKQVGSTGSRTSCAVKTDGTLWTWGINSNAALGDNTTIKRTSPVQTVAGGTNWKQVAGGDEFMMAIKDDDI